MLAIIVSAAAVAVANHARGSPGRADRSAARRVRATAPTSAAATTTTTRPRRGSGEPVTFAFAGDVHFEGSLRGRLAADPAVVLSPVARLLGDADIAMINLETAVAERGTAEAKDYTFRAPPTALDALRAAGVDVVTMANNHGLDYGATGLADSLQAITVKGLPVVGIGANAAAAFAPYLVTIKGQRIAILAATDVLEASLEAKWTATDTHGGVASAKDAVRLVAAVQAARAQADTLVVFLHWGIQDTACPSPGQQELARRLVSAGADIVVGSHTHRVEGAGRLDTGLVDYGLGNFVWYREDGESGRSGVLRVTATGRDVDAYTWVPARIGDGVPRALTGAAAATAIDDWLSRRACTDLRP